MRLDEYIHRYGFTESRSKAQDIILAGCVFVNGVRVRVKSHKLKDTDSVDVVNVHKYVSRAGDKLERAIECFDISVNGKVCLDIGASTGGFTDCLLKYGASKVYALDVGHNQLVYSLRNDDRVISIEDFNAKDIKANMFDSMPTIVVSDVSFISISKIAPVIYEELFNIECWVSLIKPQFEAERGEVSKGGVIRDDTLRIDIVNRAIDRVQNCGFKEVNRIVSPIKGTKGNIEYLSHFVRVV